jgi:predicted kinase
MKRVPPPSGRPGDNDSARQYRAEAIVVRVTDRYSMLCRARLLNMPTEDCEEIIATMWEETRGEDHEDLMHAFFWLIRDAAIANAEKEIYDLRHAWTVERMLVGGDE